jgi:ATP-dependent DNA ligase
LRCSRGCGASRRKHVFLYAFDLLELDGQDLRHEPLETRKATLASLLRRERIPARLQARTRRHRIEAPWLALPLRPLEGLAEIKNPEAPAVKREAEEDWGKERWR